MEELTSTQGLVALGAAGAALLALIWAIVLTVRVRRLRSAQRAVIGGAGPRDLVAHAATMQEAFVQLRERVEETAAQLEERVQGAEERLDGCVAHSSCVRYDAYNEMSGRQSSSMALLDSHRSGVIVSSIVHRDQARVYVKQLHHGESEIELSPEELEAIEVAMGRTPAGA
ncbi:MAG TPA: DUF4446 family protein [Thermoleophilaceae bacterium]|nr:DUF4446 family protein [Thermoleophilaceae bacterium]